MPKTHHHDQGFSLIEVLVALVLTATTATALAGVFSVVIYLTGGARHHTIETMAAVQKIEELRSIPLGAAGAGISFGGSLDVNTAGFVDFLDHHGVPVGSGTTPVPGAVYVRRWSVTSPPRSPGSTALARVFVTTVVRAGQSGATVRRGSRRPEEVMLATIVAR